MKLAVAVTGASGSIYAKTVLQKLQDISHQMEEIAIVWSDNAKTVWQQELEDQSYELVPFKTYHKDDFMAPFASGSAGYHALIICPCSMGTLGRIANGISNDLITRAADVMLKERRKLVCVVRETPYNNIHLHNMLKVSEAGGIICPATPSFYSRPKTLEDVAKTVTDRALQLCGIETTSYRWGISN